MAYAFTESRIMPKQAIASASSTKNLPLGTIVRAVDPNLGEGEFIYMNGCASATSVGLLVGWKPNASSPAVFTVTESQNTGGLTMPLGVTMVANAASTFVWLQIAGTGVVRKVASIISSTRSAVGQGATVGRVARTTSGKQILGMRFAASAAAAASTIQVWLNRPHMGAL